MNNTDTYPGAKKIRFARIFIFFFQFIDGFSAESYQFQGEQTQQVYAVENIGNQPAHDGITNDMEDTIEQSEKKGKHFGRWW